MSTPEIEAVRKAFHMIFLEGMVLPAALAKIDNELGAMAGVAEMTSFIRQSKRGINNTTHTRHREAA